MEKTVFFFFWMKEILGFPLIKGWNELENDVYFHQIKHSSKQIMTTDYKSTNLLITSIETVLLEALIIAVQVCSQEPTIIDQLSKEVSFIIQTENWWLHQL
jgi:hypothetical protein